MQRALLLLLVVLRTVTPEPFNATASPAFGELLVTAVFGGLAGPAGGAALAELAAGLLRQHGTRATAVPPPAACRAADGRSCRAAVLRALGSRRLHVALLPLAPGAAPPRWALRDAGLELLAAVAAPARRTCRVPRPPARSLLDLAVPAVAAAYPAPQGLPPAFPESPARCAATPCAALLVADAAEAAAVSEAVRGHGLLVSVHVVGAELEKYAALPTADAPLICDFAVEAALPAAAGWAVLGPPPCPSDAGNATGGWAAGGADAVGTGCAWESRELALLGDMRALARAPRGLCALLRLRLGGPALRELLAAARTADPATAARQQLARDPARCTAREVRVAALLPLTARREVVAAGGLLAAAQLAEEDEAAEVGSGAGGGAGGGDPAPRFKVEVYDAACSSRRAYKYLLDALGTAEYGALAALAGPACGAAWADVARQSAAHALPLLAYRAAAGAGGLLLRGAGGAGTGPAALAAWLAARGWRRAALLTGGAAPALGVGLAVHTQLPDAERVDHALIDQWAGRAAAAGARVLCVWSEDARELRAALCAAWRRGLRPAAGAVWLLPPAGAALRAARPGDGCEQEHLTEMLDGHFTVAPAWQAAWEQWDAPAVANLTSGVADEWRARLERHCRRWQSVSGAGSGAGSGAESGAEGDCAASASAAALYDMLRLWARALRRLHAEHPAALDDLHDPAVARELVELATGEEYLGVSGRVAWEPDDGGGWRRAGAEVVAQWAAGDRAPRQVAVWRAGRLQDDPAALRWRTADGRPPVDGTPTCGVAALADALGGSCGAAWALTAAGVGGVLLAALAAAAAGWRRRAERSFRRRLAALGLRALPAGPDRWELPRERVVITRRLGTGAFGTVYAGHALLGGGWTAVAVKTLKPGASTEEKLDFLAEAEAMKRLEHPNVVRLLAVVTQSEPVCAVLELMPGGDLKSYLLAMRGGGAESGAGAARRLTALARDAARALSYLALQRWVHGDVAARNCLVSARGLKLADFGLARRVFDADYYRSSRRGLLPVRWMAPEALRGALSPASDVWALGALLLEMATLGAAPYAGLGTAAVLARLRRARPPPLPPGLQPQLEALMKACWAATPRARPAAAEVAALLAECPRLVTPAPHWLASEGPASAGTDTTYLSSSAARDTDRFLADPDDADIDRFLADDVDTDRYLPDDAEVGRFPDADAEADRFVKEDVNMDRFLKDDADMDRFLADVGSNDADSAGPDWLDDM